MVPVFFAFFFYLFGFSRVFVVVVVHTVEPRNPFLEHQEWRVSGLAQFIM